MTEFEFALANPIAELSTLHDGHEDANWQADNYCPDTLSHLTALALDTDDFTAPDLRIHATTLDLFIHHMSVCQIVSQRVKCPTGHKMYKDTLQALIAPH